MGFLVLTCAALFQEGQLTPGEHLRRLEVDGRTRSYQIHVPKNYDPERPTPVLLIYHGALMNSIMMALSTGLNHKSDEAGFLAVYPNGTGAGEWFLAFNAGAAKGKRAENMPDDVRFTERILDDVALRCNVDAKRIYATGLSNGGMMCYLLAEKLSERIAAVAPVAGTMTSDDPRPRRAVPVMHFHGSVDSIVPATGPDERIAQIAKFKSVDDTMKAWAAIDGCRGTPIEQVLPDRFDDGTTIRRTHFGTGTGGAEVILYRIEGGGHTWPGMDTPLRRILGRSTQEISANDLMWEFFERHPLP